MAAPSTLLLFRTQIIVSLESNSYLNLMDVKCIALRMDMTIILQIARKQQLPVRSRVEKIAFALNTKISKKPKGLGNEARLKSLEEGRAAWGCGTD